MFVRDGDVVEELVVGCFSAVWCRRCNHYSSTTLADNPATSASSTAVLPPCRSFLQACITSATTPCTCAYWELGERSICCLSIFFFYIYIFLYSGAWRGPDWSRAREERDPANFFMFFQLRSNYYYYYFFFLRTTVTFLFIK